MVKYYLIGGKDDDLKSNYLEKQLLSLVNSAKVNILYFPTAMKDNLRSINHFINTLNGLSVNINVCELFNKLYSTLELDNMFNLADIIYIGGGDTRVLVDKFKEFNIDKLLIKYQNTNKIYAGISAGAILYSISGMGDSDAYVDHNRTYNFKMVDGLGLVDLYVCPHYNKEDLYIFNDEINEKPFALALEDDTAVLIENARIHSFIANTKHSVYKFEYGFMSPIKEEPKIHVLGLNTYSYFAALKHRINYNIFNPIVEHSSIRKVIESVKKDDFAIVPIENSLDGYVSETLDLLYENDLEIINELNLKISFSLVSNVSIDKISKVFVQFKARGQCLNFLSKIDKPIIETDSNIESLNLLLKNNGDFAAIVPTYLVSNFKFETSINDVCDKTNNYTRFVVLRNKKNKLNIKLENCHSSFLLIPSKDESGILYSMLKMFNDYKINLNAIMSRPTKEGLGKYYFYVEFSINDTDILNKMLENYTQDQNYVIKELGVYTKEGE